MAKKATRTGPGTPKRRKRVTAKAAAPKQRKRLVAKAGPAAPKQRKRLVAKAGALTVTEVAQLDDLRRELERTAGGSSPMRWNADPEEVRRSVAQLVLTLVEFIRKLLERQAIRRMEAGTLSDEQTEDVGRALMQLEAVVRDIAGQFGIPPEDLNLDLGPLGKLM